MRARQEATVTATEASRAWSTSTVLEEYRDDPVGWCQHVAGRALWLRQAQIAQSVAEFVRTIVGSGHKTGKTELAALLVAWWVTTRVDGRAIATAPTGRQVKQALWRALRRLWRSLETAGIHLMPEPPTDPSTGINWPDGRQILGFAADNPDNVSGPSGAEMLVVVDEGPGVDDRVWEAIQALRAGGGPVLALGNPTRTNGWFFDALDSDGWNPFNVSSLETPNCMEKRIVVPGLATLEWCQEIADDYGVDSPVYAVRVLGKPPLQASNAVIGIGLIQGAKDRYDDEDFDLQPDGLEIGVDVARYGDDFSSVAVKRGSTILTPDALERRLVFKSTVNGFDAQDVGGIVVAVMRALRRPGELVRIKVDVGGGYGEGVVQVLIAMRSHPVSAERLDAGVTIFSVNSSETALNPRKFHRRRDELWWAAREVLAYCGLAPDRQCERELLAPTYSLTPSGQIKIESKDEIKAKLKGRSPDRGDAVCLAAFVPATTLVMPKTKAAPLSRWDGTGRGFG